MYVRAQYESVPISDAYAFMMSVYPDTADGLDLMKGFTAVDTTNLPITSEELNDIRSRLGLGLPSKGKQNVDVYPGNPDLLFTHAVSKNFPEWDSTIKQMRKSSLDEFGGSYPNFVQDLKKALDKEDEDSLTLGNAIFYLDHYNMAVANGQTPAKASITGDLEKAEKAYYESFFKKGFLGKDAYNRVLADAYIKHVVNAFNLKKQDLEEGNLSDKRIHELKASLDFGSKLTTMTILKVLEQDVEDWGYTFGDTLTFELQQDGSDYTVKSTHNGSPMDLTKQSSGGVLSLDDFNEFMISKMYYGSITDLQKDSGAENPENHLTRDSSDSETATQWWANQKKYEDRVFLKKTLDTTALSLQTIDKAGPGAQNANDNTDDDNKDDEVSKDPSSSQITVGSTSEGEASTAISTDLTIGASEDISSDKTFQFNTLDKIGTFERTQEEDISLAHGEQVSLGLDNVATKDVQHNLFKEISFPTSKSEEINFSNAHAIKLDGSEDVQTVANGKAVQLNHYVPVEIDRLKATVDQDNAISLSGANNQPDAHTYSSKIRQNTLRGITVEQGEHYKIDLSKIDPENAAVKRTSSGSDSVHVEGSSKTQDKPKPKPEPKDDGSQNSGKLSLGGGSKAKADAAAAGTSGPRTGQTPANYPNSKPKYAPGTIKIGNKPGSGTTYVGNRLNAPKQSRPGYMVLGGKL